MTTIQKFTRRFILCLIAIIAFVLYYYICWDSQFFRLQFGNVIFPPEVVWTEYGERNKTSHKNDFPYQWLRMRRARTDWRAILRPCSDQLTWGTLKSGWGKANRSSAKTSFISYLDIQPSGQFSRIFIQTQTTNGQMKTVGGDFWRVLFTGPASVSAVVFDHQNGTYEAIALLMETGKYTVQAYLDYSLCDGLRDPPEDWFRVGNAQGRYQRHGTLGFLDPYIYEPLRAAQNLIFEVLPNTYRSGIDGKLVTGFAKHTYTVGTCQSPGETLVKLELRNECLHTDEFIHARPNENKSCTKADWRTYISTLNCTNSCRSLGDGYGRWRNDIWLPYLPAKHQPRKNISRPRTHRGALWIFGDSLGVRFYNSLSQKPLCKEILMSCHRSYNWVYPVPYENEALGKLYTDDFDFRPNIIIDSIRNVLRESVMKSRYSLLLLNLGLHYSSTLNFTTYQNLIDDVIVMLRDRQRGLGSNARVVWKTTTSIRKENGKLPRNETSWRFFTEQRIRLFDAYAMSAMCAAGFEVLDVFPLTASYLPGTTDVVHYEDHVFNVAEIELEKYVKTGRITTAVCI